MDAPPPSTSPAPPGSAPGGRSPLREVAQLFLKLGVIGFGGPAAHIAMMRDEVVRRRAWIDDERFLELVGATNLIPGPNSTELAIHLGHRRAGFRGLLVAGLCFIGPAVAIVSLLAWLYAEHGTDPRNTPPHAWYIAFAPAENPRVAVAVLVENGGDRLAATGGALAAPIGRATMAAALQGAS